NTIAVRVINKQPSSRWYSGSGIYRDVKLIFTDEVSVAEYGTYITTPKLAEQAGGKVDTHVETKLVNTSDKKKTVSIKYDVLDHSDNVVTTKTHSDIIEIKGNDHLLVNDIIEVDNPTLWDIDNPTMYKLKTTVSIDDTVVDVIEQRFGYRYMDWKADDGFSLNGRWLKFNGVSMHHDQGALGAVADYAAMYRQMRILKDMG